MTPVSVTQYIHQQKFGIRLHIEMAILREMVNRKEIADISWISNDVQIEDSLTKKRSTII